MRYTVAQDFETANTYTTGDSINLAIDLSDYLWEHSDSITPTSTEIRQSIEALKEGESLRYMDITITAKGANTMTYAKTITECGYSDSTTYTVAEKGALLVSLIDDLYESEEVRSEWSKAAQADCTAYGYTIEETDNAFNEWCKFEAEDLLSEAEATGEATRGNITITAE